jgi:hypothetical protein
MRTLGPITDALLKANEIEIWHFISIHFPSPTGTLRFTDRKFGFVGNVDGTSQTWNETDFQIGPIFQSRQQVLQVNWIKFANLDFTWTNYAFTPGLSNVLVRIYSAHWNTVTNAYVGSYLLYEGRIDSAELSTVANMALRPHHSPWNMQQGNEMRSGKCINVYRSPEDCQFVGSEPVGEVTCPKTRVGCAARSNTININIYDDAPKINEVINYTGAINKNLPTKTPSVGPRGVWR